MSHSSCLWRLTFATIYNPEGTPKTLITNSITAIPEFRIAGFVNNFLQGTNQFTILNFPEEITYKLEICHDDDQ